MSSGAPRNDPDPGSVARMREHWREFARKDAMFYVATDRTDWNEAEFYSVGRGFAEDVLGWAGDGFGRERMVEIGCGAGRMLVHFAAVFGRVDGFDIASEMLEAARRHGMPENVHLAVGSGADLGPVEDSSTDFVFSREVFQHIPDRDVIAAYLSETARILRPGGRAVVHFDTRPPSLRRRLALMLPDRLLPRARRRYIRRYPVPAEWVRTRVEESGLGVADERYPASDLHLLLLERPSGRAQHPA